MRDRTADRSAVANLVMRDVLDRLGKQRMADGKPGIAFDIAPSDPGAEANTILADANRIEILQMFQIDQQFRCSQAVREHRHQALTAGNHLGVSVPGCEQTDGLGNGRRRRIFKNRRLHPVSHQYVMHRLTVFIT